MSSSTDTVENVKDFWEKNPLFVGESKHEVGTLEFFEEHCRVYYEDCFAGQLDEEIFPQGKNKENVLDLGCGVGFWLIELYKRGCQRITGADLTWNALLIAQKRAEIYGVNFNLVQENAENLSFGDETFSHVNCQGVIHHTPNTEKCIEEIARVLSKGKTASISVYYRNSILRMWPILRPFGRILYKLGAKLRGRGRESIFNQSDVNEITRLYDGALNPIGKCYSKKEIVSMCKPLFDIEKVYYHFFPARALSVKIPKFLHKFLDKRLPFMIYLNLKKK